MANRGKHWKLLDEKIHDPEKWINCPICGIKPFVWEFDNGRYAECDCGEEYHRENASAIAALPYYNKHQTLVDFPDKELRNNWNKLMKIRIRKNKIKKVLDS